MTANYPESSGMSQRPRQGRPPEKRFPGTGRRTGGRLVPDPDDWMLTLCDWRTNFWHGVDGPDAATPRSACD
jgi:hypothetical protein